MSASNSSGFRSNLIINYCMADTWKIHYDRYIIFLDFTGIAKPFKIISNVSLCPNDWMDRKAREASADGEWCFGHSKNNTETAGCPFQNAFHLNCRNNVYSFHSKDLFFKKSLHDCISMYAVVRLCFIVINVVNLNDGQIFTF